MKNDRFRDMYELLADTPTLADIDYCEKEIVDIEEMDELIEGFLEGLVLNSYENRLLAKDMLRKGFILAHMKKSV